ncbi:MAG: phosphoribosylaminoimidazolesuccinocarboxamide synthase [Oscillospiraceae bacterium]|nr:phosphoribosylaminoimidazolesuccinocarboxamide synthase [Oscillospiraceae bacterium]
MKKFFEGKTKDVYQLDDGNIKLIFKDDMTGADGKFDPGANTVGVTVDGAGKAGLAMSTYFFELLEEKGYATHFISAEDNSMTVKAATPFGKGLEVICRYKALGSFIRRYGGYIENGAPLDAVIEFTLKDDERGDPLINNDALIALGILNDYQYDEIKFATQQICDVIRAELAERGLELCDIKLEFGKDVDGNTMLIDEISGGNMRVRDGDKDVSPLELSKRLV